MNCCHCTICLGAYTAPVRILHCGHSFCEKCLDHHFRTTSPKSWCPICREKVKMKKKNGAKSLTRNYALESMIQSVVNTNTTRLEGAQDFVTETHTAFLNMLPARSEPIKILALIRTYMCLCVTDLPDNGAEMVFELERTIKFITDSKRFTCSLREDPEGIYTCCTELATLTDQFIRFCCLDPAVALNNCRWLLATLLSGEKRLSQFHDIGHFNQSIAEVASSQNRHDDYSQQQFSFMDRILEEMQKETAVSSDEKAKAIAGFLKCYGCACNKLSKFTKSIQLNKQAQLLLRTEFSTNATNMKVHGYCDNNIGSAYEQQKKLSEAKRHYKRALQTYENAQDWSSHEEKQESCKLSADNLSRVRANLKRL